MRQPGCGYFIFGGWGRKDLCGKQGGDGKGSLSPLPLMGADVHTPSTHLPWPALPYASSATTAPTDGRGSLQEEHLLSVLP